MSFVACIWNNNSRKRCYYLQVSKRPNSRSGEFICCHACCDCYCWPFCCVFPVQRKVGSARSFVPKHFLGGILLHCGVSLLHQLFYLASQIYLCDCILKSGVVSKIRKFNSRELNFCRSYQLKDRCSFLHELSHAIFFSSSDVRCSSVYFTMQSFQQIKLYWR